MKIYEVRNNKVTALSALKRRSSAPQLVVVAPSGSGKSTLIYLLLNHRLIPFMKIGIGRRARLQLFLVNSVLMKESRMRRASQSRL